MRLFTHKRHLHTLSHFFPPAFFPQVHVRTHTCTHTTAQSCNSLQSAAVPFRDERTTPCSENNWNQFKDTYYHSAPCLPPPPPHPFFPFPHFLSFSRSLLAISPSPSSNSRFFIFYRVPPELFKVAATIWVIQLSPISTRHAHTYTRVQSHTSPSVYYLTLPGGRDSITELNSDPVSTAWPEKRDVCGACASLCVEERTETE